MWSDRGANTDAMTGADKKLPQKSSKVSIDAFLETVRATPLSKSAGTRGRLIFAMDATASRGPAWDRACHIQAEMFKQTAALGGLDIQLCYYRGYGEFEASPWLSSADQTDLGEYGSYPLMLTVPPSDTRASSHSMEIGATMACR